MTDRMQVLAIGECMIEMSGGADGTWRLGFAGDTLNTLWYVRAGLDPKDGPVGYFTALGDDHFSDRILAFLKLNGIETRLIRRLEGRRPGLYLIEQREGDRHFTYWRETSAARQLADDEATVAAAMKAAEAIYFSGITLAILKPDARARLIALASTARRQGKLVAFDPNIRPALWENVEVMRQTLMTAAGAASILLPSFDDERRIFGDATPGATAARYHDAGADEVAVKDGGAPVLISRDGRSRDVPVPQAAQVIDPTGAGDSFNGAYLASRLGGAEPEEAAVAGIEMAAKVIAQHGGIVPLDAARRWSS
ncbi:sugar kinase [Roseitranquillus sediminis]|uniref:sugar kinase n=1 Tax=Roseitranquillus sediminis TaxID=2809051 RepID=UPI001D0C6E28|nr:sugar kinase [Roseitranquillus sediminis]MBM9594277.1 sugar kinase [Roseitranquillus sediminis]